MEPEPMAADTPPGELASSAMPADSVAEHRPSPMVGSSVVSESSGDVVVDSPPQTTQQQLPQAPRMLTDADPIHINLSVDVEQAPEELRAGLIQIIEGHSVPYFCTLDSSSASTVPIGRKYTCARPGAAFVWRVGFERDESSKPGALSVQTVGSAPQSQDQIHNQKEDAQADQHPLVVVRYNRVIDAFRGLGLILTCARSAEAMAAMDGGRALRSPALAMPEQAQFETLALMIDCSRNGVMTVKNLNSMMRNMALMGYNMLQLYTEDTYKVPDEPFFGYLRGGYSQQELKAVDDYAYNMGIEVVPCIQTLGHLGQILQWPRYANLRDTNEVILSKYPETYELIDKLISTVSAPLRSNRIHIGMDEAYGVGEGRFRAMFGSQEGTSIFTEHLARVHEICKRHGLKPMIWSDMLFCLAAKNNALYSYYDQSNNPAEAFKVEGIPPDIDLVFWDYYHTIPEIYARKIQQHRELGCNNPWIAGAAWTWSRLWCYLPFSFESNRASLTAAKSQTDGVKSFMLTIWGDEGNECDFFSSLPVLLYVGHHAYTEKLEIDIEFMESSFAAICGGSLGDWMYSCRIDEIPPGETAMDVRPQLPSNMSKWILWEDPMLSFMSPQYASIDLESHYTQIADRLLDCAFASVNGAAAQASSVRYPLNRLLRLPGLLARVLSLKCNLRERLVEPYRRGDRAHLLQVAETRLRPMIEAQRELWLYHRARWHRIYKPFGWETLELRYGGLTARMQTLYDRIVAYALRQPFGSLRRSRAIGVTAGVSRHPALVPQQRQQNMSRSATNYGDQQPAPETTAAVATTGDDGSGANALGTTTEMPILPGPSMSVDQSSGMSLGEVPSWLPTTVMTSAPAAVASDDNSSTIAGQVSAASPGAGSDMGTVPATTIGLGWPVTVASATTATAAAAAAAAGDSTAPAIAAVSSTTNGMDAQQSQALVTSPTNVTSEPVVTCQPEDAPSMNVTTINALGVRELGGEGDFWLQPAPALPPELDPSFGVSSGFGGLGEDDDEIIESIPELDEDLLCIYENAYTSLLLDYGRVTAPSRLG